MFLPGFSRIQTMLLGSEATPNRLLVSVNWLRGVDVSGFVWQKVESNPILLLFLLLYCFKHGLTRADLAYL